jgi:hypothetical protein
MREVFLLDASSPFRFTASPCPPLGQALRRCRLRLRRFFVDNGVFASHTLSLGGDRPWNPFHVTKLQDYDEVQCRVCNVMTETVDALFDQGLERYQAGEPPADLIPLFKDVCDRAGKSSSAWTCLAWLYLLENKPSSAAKAAQKAVKLNPQDPQARVNLAIAMLEKGQKGVREHIEIAAQLVMAVPELREEVEKNFEDGLTRKPEWESAQRVYRWVFER